MSVVYSPEFKAAALDLARRIGRKPAAQRLGVATNTLVRWEHPDYARQERASSAEAKRRRKQPCARGCGRLVTYDTVTGVCVSCTNADRAPEHGTRSRYCAGCRCPDCREAHRAYMAELRRTGDPPTHGVSGYRNYGCRCPTCTAAHTVHHREWRRRAVA